jgi:ATP-binding cassette subfamily B protein
MLDLRVRIFSHIQRLSLDFFTDEKAGRIMTRMTSDVEALQILFSQGIMQLAIQGLTLIFVVAVLFSMNVKLALVVVLVIVPVLTALSIWFRDASDRAYLTVRDRIADVLADLAESLSGIRIVAAYNRQKHNNIRHRNIVGIHADANLEAARVTAIYGNGSEYLGLLAQAAILLIGGRMVLRQELSPGALTAFILYVNSFFAPIQQLVQLYNTYQQGQAAVTKLRELLGTPPSVPERRDATELPPIHGDITLDDVTFGYNPAQPVLHDVSLHVNAGETFAFVGSTGAGKSTIAKLITRFYDPSAGRVLVDGIDLREVTFESLRRQLGVVPQEPFLFAGSIRENISFAQPEATEEEIMEACRAVGIEDLIERLPMGLDTPCHERGITLSSGERQLLALARAFLAQPRVLILDEAMSNLDLGTESKVERALDVLLEGRTAILIAHRLNTAMRARRIAVIEGGRVVELGSHAELVSQGGRYADMYATWIAHMEHDPSLVGESAG